MSDVRLNWVPKALLGVAVIGLSACSACRPAVHADAYAMGWRNARVVSLLNDPREGAHAVKDCRQASTSQDTGARYVLVDYAFTFNPNLRNAMVVPLPVGFSVAVGERVLVNVKDCAQSIQTADEAPR